MKSEYRYALYYLGVQFVWLCIELVSGLQTVYKEQHPLVSMAVVIPATIVLMLGINRKKKEYEGKITFKQAFLAGMFISFVAAMLMPAVVLIFYKVVNPTFFTDFQNYAVESGIFTIEQAQNYYNLGGTMIQNAMGTLLLGTIVSGATAAMLKTKE